MSSQALQEERREATATAQESTRDPTVMAAVASVGLSWYYFFVKGDRERGLFVGLWAPTLLALANYTSMAKMQNEIRKITHPTRNIRESVQKMIGAQ